MVQERMGSLVLKRMNMVLVIGCVLGLLTGCSSRLRTTMASGSEATKVNVTQLEPEGLVAEEIIAQPISENIPMDIPVEEPARPVSQRKFASDILATPKTSDVSSDIGASLEPAHASAPPGNPIASSMPLRAELALQQPIAGIPSIAIEPEMPALPRRTPDEGSSASAPPGKPIASAMPLRAELALQQLIAGIPPIAIEPEMPALPRRFHDEVSSVAKAEVPLTLEPSAETEPMQVAKVMPQDPAMDEMTTEILGVALRDIYFDYDQFLIRDDAMLRLQVDAQVLTAKFAGKHIVIEGHCDERGTQSYNMVLGERRAKAVKSFLEHLGVPAENLQAVSYGKDKPFCMEATQDCWQKNRRGHFLIQ